MLRGKTSGHFRAKFGVDYGWSFLEGTLPLTDAQMRWISVYSVELDLYEFRQLGTQYNKGVIAVQFTHIIPKAFLCQIPASVYFYFLVK